MNTQKGDKMQKHICTALLAHVDAGKTTLAEAILYLTGGIRKLGRVDHQDAFLDNFAMERARGITIFSKQAEVMLDDMEMTAGWNGYAIRYTGTCRFFGRNGADTADS